MTVVTVVGRRGPLGQLHCRVVSKVEHRRLNHVADMADHSRSGAPRELWAAFESVLQAMVPLVCPRRALQRGTHVPESGLGTIHRCT
eukprot:COSAG06_NODE_31574_length_519_cov_0.847619_1_plen_86_part_10